MILKIFLKSDSRCESGKIKRNPRKNTLNKRNNSAKKPVIYDSI